MHNRLQQEHLFAGAPKASQCADPGSSLRWGLQELQPSGSPLPGADRSCGHTRASSPLHCHNPPTFPVLQTSSLLVLSLAEQSHPLNSGRAGSQISLPVCSTEKHVIFLCRDRNMFLIYHHLPCLGLLLKSVLFLFKNMFAFFNHVLLAIIELQTCTASLVDFPKQISCTWVLIPFPTVSTDFKLLL